MAKEQRTGGRETRKKPARTLAEKRTGKRAARRALDQPKVLVPR